LPVKLSSVATEKPVTGCPLVGRYRSSRSCPRCPMIVTLFNDILLTSGSAPLPGLRPHVKRLFITFQIRGYRSRLRAPSLSPLPCHAASLLTFRPQRAQFSCMAVLLHRWVVQLIGRTPSVFDVVKHDRLDAEDGGFLKQGEAPFDPCVAQRAGLVPALASLGAHLPFALAEIASYLDWPTSTVNGASYAVQRRSANAKRLKCVFVGTSPPDEKKDG